MPISPEFEAVQKLLFGYAGRREGRLAKRSLKLAHYTSAEVAAQVLLKRNIWMRNASSMNDYMEFSYGSGCVKEGLRRHGERFRQALDVVRPGLLNEVLERLGRSDFNHQHHTFITCLSEHRPTDELGVLSMWRAYGGPIAGVALVFDPAFLAFDSTALASWSSPVLYGEDAFLKEFDAMVARLEGGADTLKALDPDILKNATFNALQFAILSTKHVGFREEREWRVIHLPREFSSAWVPATFETVRGKPEVVHHLPLQNQAGMNMPGVDLRQLLYRVIIGPCQNPYQVASTFQDILAHLGFERPDEMIRLSLIPLRQQW